MVSGLGVNFHKSRLIWLNLSHHFVYVAANFLNCRVQSHSFDFLGFLLGANHNYVTWWDPLLKKMKDRLGNWKGRFLSLGGRISLINYVLSSLSFFSFLSSKHRVVLLRKSREYIANSSGVVMLPRGRLLGLDGSLFSCRRRMADWVLRASRSLTHLFFLNGNGVCCKGLTRFGRKYWLRDMVI